MSLKCFLFGHDYQPSQMGKRIGEHYREGGAVAIHTVLHRCTRCGDAEQGIIQKDHARELGLTDEPRQQRLGEVSENLQEESGNRANRE